MQKGPLTIFGFLKFIWIFKIYLEDLFNVHSLTKNRPDRPFEFEDTLPRTSTILNYDSSKNCKQSLDAQLPVKIVFIIRISIAVNRILARDCHKFAGGVFMFFTSSCVPAIEFLWLHIP